MIAVLCFAPAAVLATRTAGFVLLRCLRRLPFPLALLVHRLRRRRLALSLRSRDPVRELVEIEIDDRGREQSQRLADEQAADHRVAERLAQLRAGAVTEHQGH